MRRCHADLIPNLTQFHMTQFHVRPWQWARLRPHRLSIVILRVVPDVWIRIRSAASVVAPLPALVKNDEGHTRMSLRRHGMPFEASMVSAWPERYRPPAAG